MKTSIATVSLSGTLPEKLEAIAKAGFDGVEIFEQDFLTFDESPEDIGRMVKDYGLELTLFQPFRDFEAMPEPYRMRSFMRAEKKFHIMQKLGTDLLLVCSNCSTICLGGIDRTVEDLHELGERAAQYGIRIGFEALAWGRYISDHRDAWEVVRRVNHPNVGIILDSFHSLARNIESHTICSIPKEKIFIVQLSDAPQMTMDLLQWSRHFRNMPGEGDLPVKEFMVALAATGYDDYISLEIFNDQFRRGSPYLIAQDGHRALINLMDDVRREMFNVPWNLPEIPARVQVKQIAFIEFSTNELGSDALILILHQLGFKKTAQHKSKKVDLYSQGDIKLIINKDQKGFSNLSFVLHGTMAYALALYVDNAEAAKERALAMGASAFEQSVAEGEVVIPAVRGVGGGVLYFIDNSSMLGKFDEVDFIPIDPNHEGETEMKDAGLMQIDHIAQSVKDHEMLSWMSFYLAIFATSKTSPIDIIDPSGIVHSQVIETVSGSLRITLNGADNRHTLAGRFIQEKSGPGIQHIAFATKDILKTAQIFQENGFHFLKIASNYYDDIEARFGLDTHLVDQLRRYNILYDRDGYGEYFQIYSQTYGEGLFFEIVQRNKYRGYGAPNAIFRIASQKKQIKHPALPKGLFQ